MLILYGHIKPYESKFTTGMELFNESMTICILYMVLCFTPFVGDPSTRSFCGWGLIGLTSLFTAVHLTILFGSTCCSIRLYCRRRDLKDRQEAHKDKLALKKKREQKRRNAIVAEQELLNEAAQALNEGRLLRPAIDVV